jgi:hypothetical protein
MTPEVERAIAELKETWPEAIVTVTPDAQGGALVIVEDVPLFPPYTQQSTWVGFLLSFQYPYADVYPHFVRRDLTRSDGKPLGDAMTAATFAGRPAIQVSRRSNRHEPDFQTAAIKLHKVLEWLRTRPQ